MKDRSPGTISLNHILVSNFRNSGWALTADNSLTFSFVDNLLFLLECLNNFKSNYISRLYLGVKYTGVNFL